MWTAAHQPCVRLWHLPPKSCWACCTLASQVFKFSESQLAPALSSVNSVSQVELIKFVLPFAFVKHWNINLILTRVYCMVRSYRRDIVEQTTSIFLWNSETSCLDRIWSRQDVFACCLLDSSEHDVQDDLVYSIWIEHELELTHKNPYAMNALTDSLFFFAFHFSKKQKLGFLIAKHLLLSSSSYWTLRFDLFVCLFVRRFCILETRRRCRTRHHVIILLPLLVKSNTNQQHAHKSSRDSIQPN